MGDTPRVAVVGDVAWDLYLRLDRDSVFGEKLTVQESLRDVGGTGANAAAAAAKLGSETALFGSVGDDAIADTLVSKLSARGVHTAGVANVPGQSMIAVILITPHGRQVLVDRRVADRLDHVTPARVVAAGDVIYLSCVPIETAESVISDARPDQQVVLAVEGWQLQRSTVEMWGRLTEGAAAVVLNDAAAQQFLGSRRRLSDVLRCPGIVTRAASGILIVDRDGHETAVPATRVAVVDATGAGDCLSGALCHFLARGRALEEAASLANIAAGLSTTALGAQSALPTEDAVVTIAPTSGTDGPPLPIRVADIEEGTNHGSA